MEHPERRTAHDSRGIGTCSDPSPRFLALRDTSPVGVENEASLLFVKGRVHRQCTFDRMHAINKTGCNEHEAALPSRGGIDSRELFERGSLLVTLPPRHRGLVDPHRVGQRRLRHIAACLPNGRPETNFPPGDRCRVVGHGKTLRIWRSRIL